MRTTRPPNHEENKSNISNSIITNCLASTGTRVSDCDDNDWKCLCDNQRAVLTCYDNCPSGKSPKNLPTQPNPTKIPIPESHILNLLLPLSKDPNRFGAEQTSVSWCNAAKAYSSSSSSSNATVSTSSSASSSTGSSTATATDAEASSTGSSSSTGSRSSSASAASSSATDSAAGNIALPAGGVIAAVFGLAAAMI